MSETDQFIDQKQDSLIWKGLKNFSALPGWLAVAREPEQLRSELSRAIPEFRSDRLVLLEVDSSYIRYKAENWTGFIKLTIGEPGVSGTRVIDLQGVLSPPSIVTGNFPVVDNALGSLDWHAVIPDLNLELWTRQPEVVLSSLEMLTDPEKSRLYLMKAIQAGTPAYRDLDIQTCMPKVVRYKPGSRCTIVYNLSYAPGVNGYHGWPDLVVAKTYRKEKGQHAYESMLAFWKSLRSSDAVKIAEPLAYDPEMRVMIQGPIYQEKTLKDLTVSAVMAGTDQAYEELTAAMRQTARGLAALHQSATDLKNVYSWENDLAEVREFIDRLSVSIPQLAPAAIPLVDRLDKMEASTPMDERVPSHGTFRPAQVLINQGEIGFIDFDSCCKSEPAKDLGLFLCAFMRAGMATVNFDDIEVIGDPIDDFGRFTRFQRLTSISEDFLDEYERASRPVNRQRVALFEALEIFTLILHAWMKVKVKELRDITYLFEHFLQTTKILELP